MIRFHVPAVPVAQPRQRHRAVTINGRTITQNYTPAKHPVQDFKASVRQAFEAVASGPPIEGAVSLIIVFIMPRPKGMVWKSKPMPRKRHVSKPDIDNLVKGLKDALKGLAWRDDSQVSGLTAVKLIAAGDERPGVQVVIEEVP